MAEEDKRKDDLEERFPVPPSSLDVPDAPKIEVKLPPRADQPRPGVVAPGGYQKVAIAATAASSFIAPILVLSIGGWLLDQRLHKTMGLFAFVGAIIGFIAGIFSLMRIIQQLNR